MKIFEKKNIVKIEEADLKDAKLSSMDFSNELTRKRAFINVLGSRLAMKILFSEKIEANNIYSLYTIHNVLEELDLADIYYQGIKMDVRLVFNAEEIFIPKSHFEYNLLPDLYLVLNLKEDLSSAEFIGFFEPKILNKDNQNKDFYFHEKERLNKPEELKKFLDSFIVENDFEISEDNLKNAEELFLSLVDKEISKQDKIMLLKQLANNFSLREKLVDFENFELLSRAISKNETLLQDSVLDIVGTQKLFVDEPFDGELFNSEEDFELKEFKSENDSSIGDLGLLAAGMGLGAVAATTASAAAAGAQGALISGTTDVLSAGINAGSEILKNNTENEFDESLFDFDFEEESPIASDDEPEFEIINEDDTEDLLPEFEPQNEDESQDNLLEFETQDEDESEENIPEFEMQDDAETDEESELEEGLGGFEEDFGDLEINNEELPELENILDLDEIDDNFLVEESAETDTNEDEVMNLDEFDFNLLDNNENDLNDSEEQTQTKDENYEQQEETDLQAEEALQKFNDLEEEEENQTSLENQESEDDELLSQIDEFISDINLSDDQKSDLKNSSIFEGDEDEIVEAQKLIDKTEVPAPAEKTLDIDNLANSSDNLDDKDLLKFLFKEEKEEKTGEIGEIDFNETPPRPVSSPNKNKKMIIAASIATVVIASAVIGTSALKPKNTDALTKQTTAISAEGQNPSELATEDIISSETGQQDAGQDSSMEPQQQIPGENQQADSANRDMGKAVSDAFLSEPVNTIISKVAWEVPEDLAYNDSFRKYLQIAGKNVKLNLQNNLLLATEMAYSNKVVVDLEIGKGGDLRSSGIVISSGSKQIDKIVLQSVKETLKYLKMPSSELSGQSVDATLIINF